MRYEFQNQKTVRREIDDTYSLEAVIDTYKDTHNFVLLFTLEILAVNKLTMKCTDISNMNDFDDGVKCPPMYLTQARLGEYLFEFSMIDQGKALDVLLADEAAGRWSRAYLGDIRRNQILSLEALAIESDEERLVLVLHTNQEAFENRDVECGMAVIYSSQNEIFEMRPGEFMDEVEKVRQLAMSWGLPLKEEVGAGDYFSNADIDGVDKSVDFMDEEEFFEYAFTAFGPAGAGLELFDGYTSYEAAQKGQSRLMEKGYTSFSAIKGVKEQSDEMDGFTIGDQNDADEGDDE